MQRIDKITLIARTMTQDEIGQPTATESTSSVICTVKSASRAEWAAAAQRALAPAAVVTVFFRDYSGQDIAQLDGKRYSIYRTYQTGDYIELYLGTKAGELA